MVNENTKRILTSLVFVPIIIFSIFYESNSSFKYYLFLILITIVAIMIARELLAIGTIKSIRNYNLITIITVVLAITLSYISNLPDNFITSLQKYEKLNYSSIFIYLLIFSSSLVFLREAIKAKFKNSIETIALHIFTVFYGAIGIIFLIKIQHINHWHLFFIWMITWATDSGAYFIGKYFGKTKLSLKVSPNKTLEGFIGGITIGIIAAIILKFSFPETYNETLSIIYSFPYIIIITFIFTILTIIGDITESIIKRSSGVKDSNSYIPGHGGMLDVMDSLIYNSPIFYLLISFY